MGKSCTRETINSIGKSSARGMKKVLSPLTVIVWLSSLSDINETSFSFSFSHFCCWRIDLWCSFPRRRGDKGGVQKWSWSSNNFPFFPSPTPPLNLYSRQMMQHRPTASNRHNPLKTQKTNHSPKGCMSQIYPSDFGIQISDKCLA